MWWKSLFAMLMILGSTIAWSGEHSSPYAGQERREIKSLSAEEVRGYLAGDGMAFATAAELNGFPGPSHVLEMADKLKLTAEQRKRTKAIFDKVKAEAKQFGKQVVEKERELDARFAAGSVTEPELTRLVTEIAAIQGRLRNSHLQAHLAQKKVLTEEQIRHYDSIRGYQGSAAQHGSR